MTAPDSTSASGNQATSTVEPSRSTTCGSGASRGTQPSYTIRTECMSVPELLAWNRTECTCAESPIMASSPVSSCTSRTTASRGSSPNSTPPPGSVHSGDSLSHGASRQSRTIPSRTITA